MAEQGTRAPDPSLLRWMNAVSVIRTLRTVDQMTSTGLAQTLKLARSTVEEALSVLADRTLVEELPPAPRRRAGRPARRYRFRSEAGHAVGIGFDHLRITAIVSDLNGDPVTHHTRALPSDIDAVDPVDEIVATVTDAFAEAGLDGASPSAVAVGLPGVISPDGTVLRSDPAPSWVGRTISADLEARLHCPAVTENHGRMAVLGECWRGLPEPARDVVFLIGGVGVGVGTMVNGEIVRGHHGSAGEVGHHPMLSDSAVPRLRELLAAVRPGLASEEAAVEAFAAGDDPAFAEFRERYVTELSAVATMLVLTVDPEYVVLGGSLTDADDALVEQITAQINRAAMFPPSVVRTGLSDDAIATGGVRQALTLAERVLLDPVALSSATF